MDVPAPLLNVQIVPAPTPDDIDSVCIGSIRLAGYIEVSIESLYAVGHSHQYAGRFLGRSEGAIDSSCLSL